MISIKNTQVMNLEGAIRGMRNAMNSWDKADSICGLFTNNEVDDIITNYAYDTFPHFPDPDEQPKENEEAMNKIYNNAIISTREHCNEIFCLGENDMKLTQKLIVAGAPSHRKFMRQIFVCFDVDAPMYWWKEMDTYKVSTVRNSTSTMHKLATTPITRECFSMDEILLELTAGLKFAAMIDSVIENCEALRKQYLQTKDTRYWRALIQLLPSSWNQMSTYTCTYENLRSMYFDRRHHKLTEWHTFCDWIESLPYAAELITYKGEK